MTRLVSTVLFVLAGLIFVPMALEAARAARNERAQRARGGVEAAGDVYRVMRIVYPASFAAMLAEGAARGPAPSWALAAGALMFAAAKAVKWSAIVALGRAWTFRVIVVPGDPLSTAGPYRYVRHPNYIGVIGELAAAALMTGAQWVGPASLLLFGALLAKRIGVEERALQLEP